MLVSSQFWALPSNFLPVPLHGLMAGTRGSLGRNYPLPILHRWHPRALHCLRAYQLPKTGECPPWRLPLDAHMAGWRHGPLPRVPVPTTLPTRPMAPRAPHHAGPPVPRIMRAHPCPLRYPGPPWTLGLPRPTSPVPGVPTKRYSPFAATLPARRQGSCTPPNGFRAYIPTNNKTTSILSI